MVTQRGSGGGPLAGEIEGEPGRAPGSIEAVATEPEGTPTVPDRPSVVVARRRRRRWWLVALPVVGALLFGGAAFSVNRLTAPSYAADALVAVLPTDPAAPVSLPIAGIWAEVGNSDGLLRQVARRLDVDAPELAAALSLTVADNAPVVSVEVTTTDPRRSARWANAVADELLAEAARRPIAGYALRPAATAVPPSISEPLVSPLLIGVAVAFGFLLGVALAQRIARGRRPVPRDD